MDGFFYMRKEILRLAIPNVLTNLTVPLVSVVDTALMGHMPTKGHIIAIGLSVVVFNIIYWAFGFLRMGTTGLVAQKFGQEKIEASLIYLKRGLYLAIGGGIILLLLSNWIIDLSIHIFQIDVEIQRLISDYFFIRIWAAPFTISIFVITGLLLGMQDAKSSLFIALVINLLNVLLSSLFVLYFDLEIRGVAYGTLLAQLLGFAAAIWLLGSKYKLGFRLLLNAADEDRISWIDYLKINGDIFIRTLCLLAVLSFFKVHSAQINETIGAANLILLEFVTISAYGIDGFAFAAESISGKYFGMGNKILFRRSLVALMYWGIGVGVLFSLIFLTTGNYILSFLTDKKDVIDVAMVFLPWLIIAPTINAFAFIWDGIYLGVSATKLMRNTMLLAAIVFFLSFPFLHRVYDNHGVWLCLSLFMLLRGVFQTIPARKRIFSRLD